MVAQKQEINPAAEQILNDVLSYVQAEIEKRMLLFGEDWNTALQAVIFDA